MIILYVCNIHFCTKKYEFSILFIYFLHRLYTKYILKIKSSSKINLKKYKGINEYYIFFINYNKKQFLIIFVKKCGTLHDFACHPCAGAMLIFSVSFQF